MDNTTPGLGFEDHQSLAEQLQLATTRDLGRWFLSLPANERDALVPPGGTSELLRASNNAELMNQLFLENIVPNLRNVMEGSDAGIRAPGEVTPQAGSPICFSETNKVSDSSNAPMAVPQPEASLPRDEDLIATQFAERHRASFAQTLNDAGLVKWTRLCDIMLIKFFSDTGTQGSRPFYGWREETYVEYITTMYETVLRREASEFERHAITIEVKNKTGGVKSINVRTILTDPNFMDTLQRMLSEEYPRILIAHWGSVAVALIKVILPAARANRTETAQAWTRRSSFEGIYSFPFLHDSSGSIINYYAAPELLRGLELALTCPDSKTFAAIFSLNSLTSGPLKFSLLRHCNTQTTSVIASLLLTALEFVAQKKVGLLSIPWTPGDIKEKKFREVQKAIAEDIRGCLSCAVDTTLVPLARQWARRSNLLYIFGEPESI